MDKRINMLKVELEAEFESDIDKYVNLLIFFFC